MSLSGSGGDLRTIRNSSGKVAATGRILLATFLYASELRVASEGRGSEVDACSWVKTAAGSEAPLGTKSNSKTYRAAAGDSLGDCLGGPLASLLVLLSRTVC